MCQNQILSLFLKDGKESLCASDLEKLKTLFNAFVTEILGLIAPKESSGNDLTNEVMELVLKLRASAKSTKDFAKVLDLQYYLHLNHFPKEKLL